MYMKAVVKSRPGPGIDVLDVDIPEPLEGEALIRVEAVGICGSDVHIYEWTSGYEFLTGYFPLILGHEFAGEVVKTCGEKNGLFLPGDKVTGETGKTCGKCFFCKQGKGIFCEQRATYGRIGLERNGAMAGYVRIPEESLHCVPETLSMEEAAMTEPAAVALGAVELARFYPGDTVVISGPGPIGQLILQICKALGASLVLMIGKESDTSRLEVAKRTGADEVFVINGENTIKKIIELTGGKGAGVVFEASGAPSAVKSGLRMVRKAGELILVGIYQEPISIDATHHLVRQMKSVKGSYGGASLDWDRALHLIATKKINLGPLISEVMPLKQAEDAFELACKQQALKVLLRPEV